VTFLLACVSAVVPAAEAAAGSDKAGNFRCVFTVLDKIK